MNKSDCANGFQATTAATTGGTTDMATTASQLVAIFKTIVDAYNGFQGKSAGDEGFLEAIKVNSTKNGRLEIISKSGAVKLSDLEGKTAVSDLGLSNAQTDASGNGGMRFKLVLIKVKQTLSVLTICILLHLELLVLTYQHQQMLQML